MKALLEGQRVTNARLEAMENRIDRMEKKQQDIQEDIRILVHKTGENTHEIIKLKRRSELLESDPKQ